MSTEVSQLITVVETTALTVDCCKNSLVVIKYIF